MVFKKTLVTTGKKQVCEHASNKSTYHKKTYHKQYHHDAGESKRAKERDRKRGGGARESERGLQKT
jgi:hypothetical protein